MSDLASIPLPTLKVKDVTAVEFVQPQIAWLKGSDGTELACRIWIGKADGDQPVIVYLHGIEGHSQWFEHTASLLNQRGITIYAPDRRGAGLNRSERGHLFAYADMLADIEMLLAEIARKHENQPIIMMGNCWGGKAAALISSNNYKSVRGPLPKQLAGLVLTSPAIYTRVDFDLKTKMLIGYFSLKGGVYAHKYLPIPITAAMFTNDETYLEFIERDPLRLTEATVRFFFEQFFLTLKARNSAPQLKLPVLLVQSGADRIVDIGALESWYAKIPSAHKSMRVFPNAAHSIDFDATSFKEYTDLLSEWLANRKVVAAS